MSAFCDIALAVGLTFSGMCAPTTVEPRGLPPDDASAWEFPPPPAPAPPPEAPKPPAFPPVVIKEFVAVPPPAPVTEGKAEPEAPPPPPPPPDPYRLLAEDLWRGRGAVRPPGSSALDALNPTRAAPSMQLASLTSGLGSGMPTPALPTPQTPPDYEGERRLSSLPVDNSRIVTADRYITGILETGINSQIDGSTGSVVIQVSRDVFGYHGRNMLIPKGSRLICDYQSPKDIGASRLDVECKRILIAEHRAEIRNLESPAGDVQGRMGLTGEVDSRFGERYGTALMLAGISAGVRLASAAGTLVDERGTIGAIADSGAEELGTRFGEITASVLEQTVDLAPIITVPQGTRVQIRPATDWYIQEVQS